MASQLLKPKVLRSSSWSRKLQIFRDRSDALRECVWTLRPGPVPQGVYFLPSVMALNESFYALQVRPAALTSTTTSLRICPDSHPARVGVPPLEFFRQVLPQSC